MAKVVFKVDYWSAAQILRSLKLTENIMGMTNSHHFRLDGYVQDLEFVVEELKARDASIGDYGVQDEKEIVVYIEGEDS